MSTETTAVVSTEKVKVSIPGILSLLDKGLDRKAIKAELGLSHADMSKLFRLPQLANRKPTKEAGFILTDEAGNAIEMPELMAKKTRTKKVKAGEVVTASATELSVDETGGDSIQTGQEIGTAQASEPEALAVTESTENW